jgi:hypothetical protein
MPACNTLCCLRFERQGRACRDCPLRQARPHLVQPGWLRWLRQHAILPWCRGARVPRYLVRLQQLIKALVQR